MSKFAFKIVFFSFVRLLKTKIPLFLKRKNFNTEKYALDDLRNFALQRESNSKSKSRSLIIYYYS